MTEFKSARDATSAGIKPKIMPVTIDNATVNSTTFPSMPSTEPVWPSRGKPAVLTVSSARIPRYPATRPSAPPANDSIKLSVSSCCMMRQRPAPSATRTASSRRRPVARINSKFATFAHAISSTKPTAPSATSSVGRAWRTSASCSVIALKPAVGCIAA